MATKHSRANQILAAAAITALWTPASARTTDLRPIPAMPSTKTPSHPDSAVLHSLKLRLPEGQGLARMLIGAGVSQSDAASAAKIAFGHLGDGHGGCDAKVEISEALEDGAYRIERVVLLTASDETVIERRQGELVVASQQKTATLARVA